MDLLQVARVLAPHGVRGELKCRAITDFPERFKPEVRLYTGDPPTEYVVRSAKTSADIVYLRLRGINSREAADLLRGAVLQVRRTEAVELPEGQFFWSDVVGLRVENAEGTLLGTVADILPTGANDVYVVRGELGEILVPAIKDVVREIAPEQGRMVVDLLPGMLPEASPKPARGGFQRRTARRRPRTVATRNQSSPSPSPHAQP